MRPLLVGRRLGLRLAVLAAVCVLLGVGIAAVVGHGPQKSAQHQPTSSPSSSPSTSRSPSPSQVASSTPSVNLPPAGGWPNAQTTGVPASAGPLKRVGDLTVTADGATYTNLDIEGCVDVSADNVTITHSVIHCRRSLPAVWAKDAKHLVLDQDEIDGGGTAEACVAFSDFAIYRSNLHDCVDGVDFSSNVVVQGCYIHDLARGPGTHNDTLQTLGGSNDIIRGNTLQAYRADTNDPMNAVIQTGRLKHALTNVVVEHNYMDGGNYTVNAGAPAPSDDPITGYVFKANVFGRHFRFGPVRSVGSGTIFDSSNVWADTGQPVKD